MNRVSSLSFDQYLAMSDPIGGPRGSRNVASSGHAAQACPARSGKVAENTQLKETENAWSRQEAENVQFSGGRVRPIKTGCREHPAQGNRERPVFRMWKPRGMLGLGNSSEGHPEPKPARPLLGPRPVLYSKFSPTHDPNSPSQQRRSGAHRGRKCSECNHYKLPGNSLTLQSY